MEFDGVLEDMTAGELIELLMVNRDRNMDDFFWYEQLERVLCELQTRLKDDEVMDVKALVKMIKQSAYR